MKHRERIILEYIIKFKQVNQYSPSVKEIMTGINSRSYSYVTEGLENLRAEGYITYKERSARTIKVLKFIA